MTLQNSGHCRTCQSMIPLAVINSVRNTEKQLRTLKLVFSFANQVIMGCTIEWRAYI